MRKTNKMINSDLYLEDNSNNSEPWHNSPRLYAVYHNTVPLKRIEELLHDTWLQRRGTEDLLSGVEARAALPERRRERCSLISIRFANFR